MANLEGNSVDAFGAIRGQKYVCPNCKNNLILKQGRIVVHHFAHKPPISCDWAVGETKAHLDAKRIVRDSLITRGLKAEAEFVVKTLPGDRRADVMTWRADDQRVAIELQHTSISLPEIELRAFSYARAGIAQIWVPFLRPNVLEKAIKRGKESVVARYSPRPFEKWVHGLNGKEGMWMYCPNRQNFWLAHLKPHQLYAKESNWYSEGGEECQ